MGVPTLATKIVKLHDVGSTCEPKKRTKGYFYESSSALVEHSTRFMI